MCKEPRQRRGEARVAGLLTAAREEFSARGYEAATMSSIARRAKASIGSLYQFFPNKQAVARALRTQQIMDAEELWKGLEGHAAAGNAGDFVARFVEAMIIFVDDHPAFLPLLDAPSSTQPVGARNRLRQQMERMLGELWPRRDGRELARIAEVVLNINKTMMGLYAAARADDRAWIVAEYSGMLGAYLTRQLGEERGRGKKLATETRRRAGAQRQSV